MKKVFNGLNITYRYTRQEGASEVVLLLHGWGGSLNSFRTLEKQLTQSGFSVITLDFPAFGGSDCPPEDFTMNDYYRVVSELLACENINSVNVVGHSFGGRVAMLLSANEPQKIKKLILVDSAGIKPKFSLKKSLKIWKYKVLKKLKNKGIIKKDLSNFGSADYKAMPEKLRPVFNRIVTTDLSEISKKIIAPTLLIWGTQDKDTPIYMAKKLNKNIKDSAIIKFENCGHFCYLERPQEFFKIVENFFK